jgi:hypothetical protein
LKYNYQKVNGSVFVKQCLQHEFFNGLRETIFCRVPATMRAQPDRAGLSQLQQGTAGVSMPHQVSPRQS